MGEKKTDLDSPRENGFAQLLFAFDHNRHIFVGDRGDFQAELRCRGSNLAHQLVVREDAEAVQLRVVLHALAALLQPVGRSEIHGFGEVVALIEPAVVSPRKGHHELARVLVDTINRNASVHQRVRIHYCH